MLKFLFAGQTAEKQKEYSFFKAKAVFFFNVSNEIVYIIASVNKLSGNSFNFALVKDIAVNIAYICNSGYDAGTVTVAESPFNVIFVVKLGVN